MLNVIKIEKRQKKKSNDIPVIEVIKNIENIDFNKIDEDGNDHYTVNIIGQKWARSEYLHFVTHIALFDHGEALLALQKDLQGLVPFVCKKIYVEHGNKTIIVFETPKKIRKNAKKVV